MSQHSPPIPNPLGFSMAQGYVQAVARRLSFSSTSHPSWPTEQYCLFYRRLCGSTLSSPAVIIDTALPPNAHLKPPISDPCQRFCLLNSHLPPLTPPAEAAARAWYFSLCVLLLPLFSLCSCCRLRPTVCSLVAPSLLLHSLCHFDSEFSASNCLPVRSPPLWLSPPVVSLCWPCCYLQISFAFRSSHSFVASPCFVTFIACLLGATFLSLILCI